MAEHILPELSDDEAQTRFDELLDRAERGQAFVITRNGRPVAKLIPGDGIEEPQQPVPRQGGAT